MSLLFDDASSEYLDLVQTVALSEGTFAAWVYLDDVGINQAILSYKDDTASDYETLYATSAAALEHRSNGATLESASIAAALSVNTWHHVASSFVFDNERNVYIDGGSKTTDTVDKNGSTTSLDEFYIGSLDGTTGYVSGRIAHAAFWSVKLTDAEIAALATGVSPWLIRPDALVWYTPLVDGQPTNLMGTDFTLNGTPTFAPNPPVTIFSPPQAITALDDRYNQLASVVFTPSVSAVKTLNLTVQNNITFGQTLNRNVEYTRTLQTDIVIFNDSFSQVKLFTLQTDVVFTPTIDRDLVIPITLQNNFYTEVSAHRTIEDSVQADITFTSSTNRAASPTNLITFTPSASAVNSKPASNAILFAASLGVNTELNPSVQADVTFTPTAYAELVSECNTTGLPADTTILMQATGATDLSLRGPEFGDVQAVATARLINTTRGGKARLYRNSIWPNNNELSFRIVGLTQAEGDDVLTFIRESLGKLVTLTDHHDRVWQGVISNPQDVEITNSGTCKYEAEFNLIGVLQ